MLVSSELDEDRSIPSSSFSTVPSQRHILTTSLRVSPVLPPMMSVWKSSHKVSHWQKQFATEEQGRTTFQIRRCSLWLAVWHCISFFRQLLRIFCVQVRRTSRWRHKHDWKNYSLTNDMKSLVTVWGVVRFYGNYWSHARLSYWRFVWVSWLNIKLPLISIIINSSFSVRYFGFLY